FLRRPGRADGRRLRHIREPERGHAAHPAAAAAAAPTHRPGSPAAREFAATAARNRDDALWPAPAPDGPHEPGASPLPDSPAANPLPAAHGAVGAVGHGLGGPQS